VHSILPSCSPICPATRRGAMPFDPQPVVSESLQLRTWARGVLAGLLQPVPPADAASWRVFLEVERCALPLRHRLGKRALPSAAEEALDLELQRVLSLRALVERADRALADAGAVAVALKGAAPFLSAGEELDVADLDLLVQEPAIPTVAAALEASGLSVGRDTAEGIPSSAPGGHERAARTGEGTIHVELHAVVPSLPASSNLWATAEPTRFPRLRLLAPVLHLYHLLMHSVVQHPEKRGILRELLLMRQALRRCTRDEQGSVATLFANHPLRCMLDAMIGLADDPSRADCFIAEAALSYRLAADPHAYTSRRQSLWLIGAAYALLAGRGEYRRLWYGSPRSAWGEGASPRAFGLADPLRPLRFAWRAGLLLSVTPAAWKAAREARRAAS